MQVTEQESMAMFRFAVISPLVCRRFEEDSHRVQAMREILAKEWKYPDGSVAKVPSRTVRYWLSRYGKFGLDGLYDGLRKDRGNKGRVKAIPADVLEKAESLRRELPSRSARVILQLLEMQGFNVQNFSERTLQRHLKRLGAKRAQLERGEEYFERWEQKQANDLWQADTAHAIWLPDPTNPKKTRRTKLIAFIDDATRICTHGEFYFDEKAPQLDRYFLKGSNWLRQAAKIVARQCIYFSFSNAANHV